MATVGVKGLTVQATDRQTDRQTDNNDNIITT